MCKKWLCHADCLTSIGTSCRVNYYYSIKIRRGGRSCAAPPPRPFAACQPAPFASMSGRGEPAPAMARAIKIAGAAALRVAQPVARLGAQREGHGPAMPPP